MHEKPMAKYEAEHMKALGMTREEYRYSQAVAWAILMGEPMPEKPAILREREVIPEQ